MEDMCKNSMYSTCLVGVKLKLLPIKVCKCSFYSVELNTITPGSGNNYVQDRRDGEYLFVWDKIIGRYKQLENFLEDCNLYGFSYRHLFRDDNFSPPFMGYHNYVTYSLHE